MVEKSTEMTLPGPVDKLIRDFDARIEVTKMVYAASNNHTREGVLKAYEAAKVFMNTAVEILQGEMNEVLSSLEEGHDGKLN